MTQNLKPLGDRVVVEPIEQDEVTASGLLLPETAKEKPQKGLVVAAGSGARDEDGQRVPLDVNPGDTVLFAKYGGTEFKIESRKLLILRETELLAIVMTSGEPKKKK